MKTFSAVALLVSFMSTPLLATDVDHYKGKPSPDLKSALCNLQSHDADFKAMIGNDPMKVEDLAKLHQMTYTMEVALQKVQQELVKAAESLEKVHKASEVLAGDNVKVTAPDYLNITQLLTSGVECK